MKTKETLKHFPVNRSMHQTDVMVHHMGEKSVMPRFWHDKLHKLRQLKMFHKKPVKQGIPKMNYSRQQSVMMAVRHFWAF